MRRYFLLSSCLVAVLITAACSNESKLPTPTGKGSVRAINAISTSPTISFFIEERSIGDVDFKSASNKTPYDDFVYNFNFEALLPNDTERARIASQTLQVVKDMEYTFVISGDLATPTITVWEKPERVFADGDTVFEAAVGHMSPALGNVDIFLDDPAVIPAAGNEIGTLAPGERLPPTDLQAGDYILTITTAGMPGEVRFASDVLTLDAASTLLFMIFDRDANDRGPVDDRGLVSVRAFNGVTGAISSIADPFFPPTVRFLHASQDLGIADIFIDDPLTTPLIEDQDFRGISAEFEVAEGALPVTYTAFDNIGTILVDDDLSVPAGVRIDYYVVGEGASPDSVTALPDRRSVESFARFTLVYTETNHGLLDFYTVVSGTDIADVAPRYVGLTAGLDPIRSQFVAGSFDLYLTETGEKTVVVGPIQLDVALGDVVTAIVYDTVDTSTAEIVIIPDF
jgi:hypothetical protein